MSDMSYALKSQTTLIVSSRTLLLTQDQVLKYMVLSQVYNVIIRLSTITVEPFSVLQLPCSLSLVSLGLYNSSSHLSVVGDRGNKHPSIYGRRQGKQASIHLSMVGDRGKLQVLVSRIVFYSVFIEQTDQMKERGASQQCTGSDSNPTLTLVCPGLRY